MTLTPKLVGAFACWWPHLEVNVAGVLEGAEDDQVIGRVVLKAPRLSVEGLGFEVEGLGSTTLC